MALRDFTRGQVLAAIEEYDALGQEGFLAKYGFDRSRTYLLIHDGKTYDSKAIVGAAHGVGRGNQPLSAGQFSGGEATVGRLLRRLGFTAEASGDQDTAELIKRITGLAVDRSSGRPALYQPITLLWAIGRAYRSEARMESWSTTRQQVAELLESTARAHGHERIIRSRPSDGRDCGSSMSARNKCRTRTATRSFGAGSTRISRAAGLSCGQTTFCVIRRRLGCHGGRRDSGLVPLEYGFCGAA